ncbi:MAG: MmgE/PrpD family protein [Chloroflexota bacterium]|nr:MmgE/PrpD family protein [Chloroflexota bacterium]MDE2685699.1 MmgE/PrpD family protein [Chloroflexota bacterium]
MDRTTELLSSYACNLSYEDLPPEVIHQVKRTVADTLGCAVGGYLSEPAKVARKLAGDITSGTPSRILGTNDYSSLDMAGFANGVMVRYLDCNDSYFSPGGGHPSDMIPAALAVADSAEADGKTLITAIALAYEAFCRIADQVPDNQWDQGIFSVIGAACAAGKVLGLDEEQMGHAISLAAVPNVPLRVTRMGELSMWKGCAAAAATRSGVFAAQLAAEGMTGPFEPFEGRKGLWEQAIGYPVEIEALGGEDSPFRILNTIFKFYPSQIHTQAPIDLAIQLHEMVQPDDIASIKIQSYNSAVSSASTEPEKWDPKTRETADHSIPFLTAVGLRDGAVTPATFAPDRIADAGLRTIINKMRIDENPEFTERYPEQYNCRIEVIKSNGQTEVASTSYPKGHGKNPLSDAEVDAKFRRLACPTVTEQQCEQALELIWSLENLPNLRGIFDSLVV